FSEVQLRFGMVASRPCRRGPDGAVVVRFLSSSSSPFVVEKIWGTFDERGRARRPRCLRKVNGYPMLPLQASNRIMVNYRLFSRACKAASRYCNLFVARL